jgi:molybdopterin synthase catalytic subunit
MQEWVIVIVNSSNKNLSTGLDRQKLRITIWKKEKTEVKESANVRNDDK